MYKEALMKIVPFFVMSEVTLMVCWFYRAAQILCKFCQVCLVTHFQCHLMVHVMSAIQQYAVVVEERSIAVNEEAPTGVKQ